MKTGASDPFDDDGGNEISETEPTDAEAAEGDLYRGPRIHDRGTIQAMRRRRAREWKKTRREKARRDRGIRVCRVHRVWEWWAARGARRDARGRGPTTGGVRCPRAW